MMFIWISSAFAKNHFLDMNDVPVGSTKRTSSIHNDYCQIDTIDNATCFQGERVSFVGSDSL